MLQVTVNNNYCMDQVQGLHGLSVLPTLILHMQTQAGDEL